MPNIVTWNMEGGSHDGDSKWHTGIQQLVKAGSGSIALCLQESGMPPSSVTPYAGAMPGWRNNAAPPPNTWGFSQWRPGVTPYYLLWLITDPNGHRVNLAVLTPQVPTQFFYVNPGLANARPALGMTLADGSHVFSLHALSGNGNDAPGLINNIALAVPNNEAWWAAGDFNCEPGQWVVPAGVLCPPNTYTRWKSKRTLDYLVRNAGTALKGQVFTELTLSDHWPVGY